MARQSIQLAQISPADIIADTDLDLPEEFYDSPRAVERLEYAIADAVTNLLPDLLIVAQSERLDGSRVWNVLQPLDPATKRVGSRGMLEDDATPAHEQATAWLTDLSRVAQAINLDEIARDAVRHAGLALQADA
jgi:hypothetical protein